MLVWREEEGGGGGKPSQPATPMWGLVIAETLDHIYLQFTPSCLDLWAIQGITFPTQRKKASKQARVGGGRWRGWMDGGREKRPGPSVWMLVGIVKRAERWQLNALIFCWDSGFVSQGGLSHGAVTSRDRWTFFLRSQRSRVWWLNIGTKCLINAVWICSRCLAGLTNLIQAYMCPSVH